MRDTLPESATSLLNNKILPDKKLKGRFAVIKLWPELKTAEDECIARLKITAESLGLECLEVDSFANLLVPPHTRLTQNDVDFVLSLHYDTPKRYDIFSFVALWNPLQFFYEWGYRRCTRNLLTHDDYLSCSSPWADDHLARQLVGAPMRQPPELHLYHSLSEPILPPTTGERKLFYAGINWERVSNKPQRHAALLKLLDSSGDLRIYGPRLFQGVNVWSGYRSYAGPIPFDGVSMIRLIHKAGVSLVLSSDAHRQSELMSSRLFESLAAGAVIICDENPFARRYFGKTLLYVDAGLGAEQTYEQVQSHLEWIRSNPVKATDLAREAQEIFRSQFSLDICLRTLYHELPARKQKLECLRIPTRPKERVSVLFLMPEFTPHALERHIESCLAQQHVSIRPMLVMDNRDAEIFGPRVRARLNELEVPIYLETIRFYERHSDGSVRSRRRLGSIIQESIQDLIEDDYFCLVGPQESIFSDHIASLLRVLQDDIDSGSAWTDMLWSHASDGVPHADLADEPSRVNLSIERPLGFARFLFRRSALPRDLPVALPYLDFYAVALLFGVTSSIPTRRCSMVLDIQDRYSVRLATEARPQEEREILIDFAPSLFQPASGGSGSSLQSMTTEQKLNLAVELAHSVPFPKFLKKIGFGLYRFWLRHQKTIQ